MMEPNLMGIVVTGFIAGSGVTFAVLIRLVNDEIERLRKRNEQLLSQMVLFDAWAATIDQLLKDKATGGE